MIRATQSFLQQLDAYADQRRQEILASADALPEGKNTYYVSVDGDDNHPGTRDLPWKTLRKVTNVPLQSGDKVLFRRGDLFRGSMHAQPGILYGAYGEGAKPRFYGWDKPLSDPALWEIHDESRHIWRLRDKILDCGTLVFDGGDRHSRKLIPSYLNGRYVCRDDEKRVFDMAREMTQDLDIFCHVAEEMTTRPSKGESFPIPHLTEETLGSLYLRCDRGNPGEVFREIEAVPRRHMIRVSGCDNVHIDNLCLKYIGMHAISGNRFIRGLHVTNCEIGWIGGTIQHYLGTDPNYPQGGRGTVTRFGNGVEIYGGCEDYLVENCWIYQVYDAAITHQITTCGKFFRMENIRYRRNLIEKCVYGIEYFLNKTEGDTQSYIVDCEMSGNILRCSGCGWGQQRHNTHTPAHIKGWSFENTARDFKIHHNLFDRSAYRMLHLVAKEKDSCPRLHDNVYVQRLYGCLGQYGANGEAEPEMLPYDLSAGEKIRDVLHDENAQVYYIGE